MSVSCVPCPGGSGVIAVTVAGGRGVPGWVKVLRGWEIVRVRGRAGWLGANVCVDGMMLSIYGNYLAL